MSDDDLPLFDPPERIRELHVWVAEHADASQGILSFDLMPLMHSNLAAAEQLCPLAEMAAAHACRQGIEVTGVRLLSFDLRVKEP